MTISNNILDKIGEFYFFEGTTSQALQSISFLESVGSNKILIYSLTDNDEQFVKSMFDYFKSKQIITKYILTTSLENKHEIIQHKNYNKIEIGKMNNLKKYFDIESLKKISEDYTRNYYLKNNVYVLPLMNNIDSIGIVVYNIYIQNLIQDNSIVILSGTKINGLPCVIENPRIIDIRGNDFIKFCSSLFQQKCILLENNISVELCKLFDIQYEMPDNDIVNNIIEKNLNTEFKKQYNTLPKNTTSQDFNECVQQGIIPIVRQGVDCLYLYPMSASIVIHADNNKESLRMLLQSIYESDRKDIDYEIIITSCSMFDEEYIKNKVDEYKGKLNIKYFHFNIDEVKKKYEEENKEGVFHEFSYVSNAVLKHIQKDIVIFCDVNIIVNKDWMRSLCSPHYVYTNRKIIVKNKGGDFTIDSTVFLQDKRFNKEYFNLEHANNEYQAGLGNGWSIKTKLLKALGGFDVKLSNDGSQADELIFRAMMDNAQFIGNAKGYAIHRQTINNTNSNYFYKLIKKKHLNGNPPSIYIRNFSEVKELFEYKNYV